MLLQHISICQVVPIARAPTARVSLSARRDVLVRRVRGLIFATAMAACSSTAHSEVIHFQMTGYVTVDFSLGTLPDGIYEGAPFQVDLSYDIATPDAEPNDPQRGLYPTVVDTSNFLHFRAGPAEVQAHDLWLWVGNDLDEGATLENGRPLWELPDDAFLMLNSQVISNFPIATFNSIVFAWRDPSRAALSSDNLPNHLNLGAFQNTWFTISTGSLNPHQDQFTVRAIVTSVSAVPEPVTFCTSITGSLIVWWYMASQRRSLYWQESVR